MNYIKAKPAGDYYYCFININMEQVSFSIQVKTIEHHTIPYHTPYLVQ